MRIELCGAEKMSPMISFIAAIDEGSWKGIKVRD